MRRSAARCARVGPVDVGQVEAGQGNGIIFKVGFGAVGSGVARRSGARSVRVWPGMVGSSLVWRGMVHPDVVW